MPQQLQLNMEASRSYQRTVAFAIVLSRNKSVPVLMGVITRVMTPCKGSLCFTKQVMRETHALFCFIQLFYSIFQNKS